MKTNSQVAFRREMGEAFFKELRARIDRRMVVVHERQERRKVWLWRAREANRNLVVTR